jgi:hypothetical protein
VPEGLEMEKGSLFLWDRRGKETRRGWGGGKRKIRISHWVVWVWSIRRYLISAHSNIREQSCMHLGGQEHSVVSLSVAPDAIYRWQVGRETVRFRFLWIATAYKDLLWPPTPNSKMPEIWLEIFPWPFNLLMLSSLKIHHYIPNLLKGGGIS